MTVHEVVERERVRVRRLHVGAGVALAAAATATVLLVGVVALGDSRWLALPRPMPLVVWLLALGAVAATAWWTLRRLRAEATRGRVAEAIEREQRLRAGQLRGVLEVAESGALGRRAAESLGSQLAGAGPALAPGLQRRARHGLLRAGVAAAVTIALLGVVAPAFGDGLMALLRPVHAWRGTLLPALGFDALPHEALRNEPLRVRVLAPGRQSVTLHARTTGEGWRSLVLRNPNGARVVEAALGPMAGDLTLVVDDGRTRSDTATVKVTDRPFLGAVVMQAVYPRYLGRAPEGLAVGEPARVPAGTVIDVRGRASTALSRVRLVAQGDTLALRPSAHAFAGRIEARRSGRYVWVADGASGPIPDVPPPFELVVLPDSAPRVELLSPGRDTVVVPEGDLPMRATASDDHGVAAVELVSWRVTAAGERQPAVSQRLDAAASTEWAGTATLSLAMRGLAPGDALHAKVVATDNSPWTQRGESREVVLRVPSLEEQRSLARSTADSAVQGARQLAQAQRALAQRTEDASRERGERGSSTGKSTEGQASGKTSDDENAQQAMSYQAAEKARGIAKEQRALADKSQELRRAAQQLEQQLKAAGALDSSLARQLRDVQQLLKEALTPELMEQMRKLESASQQLSGDQARQSLRDLAEAQKKLREQIEKSAEMLRRAALEGAMQTLADEAKEIAKQERGLADSAATRGERGADDARRLAERSKQLTDDVKDLQDRLEREKAEAGARQSEEARQRAAASERAMRKAAGEQRAERQTQTAASPKAGEQKAGEQKTGEQKTGEQKAGEQAAGERNAGRQPAGGQQQDGQPQDGQQKGGQRGAQAREASEQMSKAAQAMQNARDAQVSEWKQELTAELDRSIQELLQMGREESALEKQARAGGSSAEQLRGAQSSISQGADQTSRRLDQAGKKSSLLSGRSERAMNEARQKVSQATQQLAQERAGSNGQGSASALGEAADALNRAAASLARDRERANSAKSASGFAEMLQQLQELAKKQGGINGQAQGLMQMPGGPQGPGAQATARALARQQRGVAEQLDELSDEAAGARAGELAKEAKQVADALEGGRIDQGTLARQQQLFRRLLDAGRSLEKEEREDDTKREAKSATGDETFTPGGANAAGKAATRFREPTWNELRGLSPEERRAILDYFKRINAQKP